jgi:hypothetical protein
MASAAWRAPSLVYVGAVDLHSAGTDGEFASDNLFGAAAHQPVEHLALAPRKFGHPFPSGDRAALRLAMRSNLFGDACKASRQDSRVERQGKHDEHASLDCRNDIVGCGVVAQRDHRQPAPGAGQRSDNIRGVRVLRFVGTNQGDAGRRCPLDQFTERAVDLATVPHIEAEAGQFGAVAAGAVDDVKGLLLFHAGECVAPPLAFHAEAPPFWNLKPPLAGVYAPSRAPRYLRFG